MKTKTLYNPTDKQLEKLAFEAFATAHPHEAHASWPDRFWKFFKRKRPGVSRKRMEQLLKETNDSRLATGSVR